MSWPTKPARRAFLTAIGAARWDDELPRLVYADWLDENGEHEEAERQRKYVPAERWLTRVRRELISSDEDDPPWDPISYETLIEAALTFLRTEDEDFPPYETLYCLPFETPDVVYEQREALWKNIEIVTGLAVSGRDRQFMIFRVRMLSRTLLRWRRS